MMLFRRLLDATLLWLVLGATAGAVRGGQLVAECPPATRCRSPAPDLAGEVRGLSAEQVIECLNRRGPSWSFPPDVVE